MTMLIPADMNLIVRDARSRNGWRAMAAPVTAVIACDTQFYEPRLGLFPRNPQPRFDRVGKLL